MSETAHYIELRLAAEADAVWDDEIFLGMRLNPIAHGLFDGSTREEAKLDPQLAMIRLGGILWISWVKRRSRSYPGSPARYLSGLCRLLRGQFGRGAEAVSDPSDDDDDDLSVRLWLAVLCGISSSPESPERAVAVQLMADTARRLGITGWEGARMCVGQMPWITAFDEPCVEMWEQLR